MDNVSPPKSNPVDIDEIKNSLPGGKKTGMVPTVIIQSAMPGPNEETQGKIKFLERIIKTELLFNVLLVLLLAVTVYVSLVLRIDILKFFNKKVAPIVGQSNNVVGSLNSSFRVMAAEPAFLSPVYINRQGVDLEKTFQDSSSSARLTAYNRLKNEVMGFLPYWVIPKLDQIDISTVTSISYFGLEVNGKGDVIQYDDSGKPIEAWTYLQKDKRLANFINKAKQSKLKIYLTLKCFNQDNIVSLVTSEKTRENFIKNAIFLMNSKALSGLNIDFEYIGTPDEKVKNGFSALIIDLYKAMKKQYPNSVLTIDTFVDAASANRIHDIPVLAQNSDGLVIMGYDFHTPNSSTAGPVAPFEGSSLSIKGLMASYLDKAPAEKLILAVPYYGYDWPVKQGSSAFEVTGVKQEVNILPYGEIASATKNTNISWDETAQVPWYSYQDSITKQSRVVYFENVRSLGIKYDFVTQKKLQGIAIWALGFDGKRGELNQIIADKFAK